MITMPLDALYAWTIATVGAAILLGTLIGYLKAEADILLRPRRGAKGLIRPRKPAPVPSPKVPSDFHSGSPTRELWKPLPGMANYPQYPFLLTRRVGS